MQFEFVDSLIIFGVIVAIIIIIPSIIHKICIAKETKRIFKNNQGEENDK